MTDETEKTYISDIVRSEAPNYMSRKRVTIASSAALLAGTVLGLITMSTASAAAFAGNAGDGAMGAITVADGAKPGVYKLTIVEPGTDVGTFTVEDPDGILVGTGVVATEFSAGGLTFTLADGSADFVAGDGFDITVAAGSGKYKKAPETAADGSDAGAAILLEDADASAGDVADVLVLYRDAQVSLDALIYDDTVDDATKKAAVRAGLEANNIQFLSAA